MPREVNGALEEAEALYARALAVRPRNSDILNHLASVRLARVMAPAQQRRSAVRWPLPEARARKLFVELVRRFGGSGEGDDEIRRLMVRALTEPWDRPGALSHAAARLDPVSSAIGPLVTRADAAWPNRSSLTQLLGDAGFTPLADDALLIALLVSAPNTDIPLERFLTMLRGAMMRELASSPETSTQTQVFAAALAQQCFINDYVFLPSEDELAAAAVARAALEKADIATPMQIL